MGWCEHSSQAQAVVALNLLHQGPEDCFHFCYLKKNGSVGLTRCVGSSLQLLLSLRQWSEIPVSMNGVVTVLTDNRKRPTWEFSVVFQQLLSTVALSYYV